MTVSHIDIHAHAEDDLKTLRVSDLAAAAAVYVALEQIESDPKAIDKLTTKGSEDVGGAYLGVKPWREALKAMHGNDSMWRLRILDTAATSYRVIYVYRYLSAKNQQIVVLAVAHKDEINYDDLTNPLAKRIFADWRDL